MGPIIIFDKSVLQMLNQEESYWLDAFFLSNITPLFYMESLADLAKEKSDSQVNPRDIVVSLAEKTPQLSRKLNTYHRTLIIQELLGYPVEMSNRPILSGGKTIRQLDGRVGIHFEQSPESEAIQRWCKKEFQQVEEMIALSWRQTIDYLDPSEAISIVKNIIPVNKNFADLKEIVAFVEDFVNGDDEHITQLGLELLGIPEDISREVLSKTEKTGKGLKGLYPYTAYCFKVDLIFYLATHFQQLSLRKTNRVDISYLYYLPFCMVFTSDDTLHRRIAPLLITEDQSFIAGKDLKDSLKEMDEYYSKLPEKVLELGSLRYAQYPPSSIDNGVTKLWDKYMLKDWREKAKEREESGYPLPKQSPELIKKIKEEMKKGKIINNQEMSNQEIDYVITKENVSVKRGKYRSVSQDIADKTKDES